ncbi:MAG: hypothetical protein MRK02_15260 [Candidatus Scalindua sp.]|nr:hypothetical protein [Candidatus Scalindua sp.]
MVLESYKYSLTVSLLMALLLLSLFHERSNPYAEESLSKDDRIEGTMITIKNVDSCTERCHANYLAYENKFEATQRTEIFRHGSHSFEQNLDCTSCHDDSEVNTERHGRLTIKEENCLTCHHVELKVSECKRCHSDIDENPMKYKEQEFIHGFTVESDVDCGLCHIKNSNASLKKEEINCVKCHHTTPDLDCVKCHKDELVRYFDSDPDRRNNLSWSVSFSHSEHPEEDITCKECHVISDQNESGIVEYNLNCSKCHHTSEKKKGCIECHREPSEFLQGKTVIQGIKPVPDMMSRAVTCEDCHKYNSEKLKFSGVEEYCIKCHNEDYGRLYNAWTKTITDRLKKFTRRLQNLVEESTVAFKKHSDSDTDKYGEAGGRSGLEKFFNDTDVTVDSITKYGIHNFNLTRMILDSLEEKIK